MLRSKAGIEEYIRTAVAAEGVCDALGETRSWADQQAWALSQGDISRWIMGLHPRSLLSLVMSVKVQGGEQAQNNAIR